MVEDAPRIRLIAGLGNPGAEYAGTRHNVGFAVVDHLAAEERLEWQHSSKWAAVWTKSGAIFFVKPWSYMNRSGEALAAFADFYKIGAPEILVVLDDLALPPGRLRIRPGGSSAGHNGLESIFMHFGTDEIPRLRIGIGSAPGAGSVDYVLGRFFEEEKPVIEKAVVRAAAAVKWAIDKGVLSAMNTFNKAEP